MKHIFYLSALTLLFACAKKKDGLADRNTLSGKWKLSSVASSNGGPLEERRADPAKAFVIDFRADSSFTSTEPGNQYNRYSIDSVNHLVTISGQGVITTTSRFNVIKGTLRLTPVNPACIEGCFTQYMAVN